MNKIIITSAILIFTVLPTKVFAQGLFDGGMISGMETECDCQGEGMDITVQSYVDQSDYVYLYMPGLTQLFMNYNIESPDNYFLTTLEPIGVCLVGVDPYCDDDSPDGVFELTGTSFNVDKNSVLGFINKFPGAKQFTKTFSELIPNKLSPTSLKLPKLST